MRYSIRSLMFTTLVVAIVWLPAAAMMKWMSDPKSLANFGLGLSRTYAFMMYWDVSELDKEWDGVSSGNNEYVDDYISGHIFGWTLMAILLWAGAMVMWRGIESFANSDYGIRIRKIVGRWRRRRRSKNRACRQSEKDMIRESLLRHP